ncbi:MAG TPA: PAS domain S-box protein [Candidatus Limnocylindria bacterium]|nr:PAS domain S-box protein [Candidatus Limnocylindria bacterium]
MTADSELLQSAVTEVARLLDADGAMIYLLDEASGELRFAHDAGITDPEARRLIRDLTLPVGMGMFGTAVARGRLTVTDDYPADRRFTHSPVADRIVQAAGMRSMAVAPLLANGRPLGAMGAYSSRPAAFSEAEIALLRALADHAATAIANQRLMAQLTASEQRYRNLVEGSPDVVWATDAAGNFTFLSETVEQLTGRRSDELLGRHWSVIVAAEDREEFQRVWRDSQLSGDEERRARFRIQRDGGALVIAELRGRERLVNGRSAGAHGSIRDVTDVARLEQSLRNQADELALRVETQKTLHAITSRITAIRNPEEVLQQVVDAAQRLLGSDGAHLTLRDPDAPILRPHVIAGGMDEAARQWLAGMEFPIGGGMNGLAAESGRPVWTHDYLVDPRIPHTDEDQDVANRMGLRGMAVAPLRAPGGEVFGTLAISYVEPRDIGDDQIQLLQGLADVGAIAIANARLYEQVAESERRYRFLVENSPDLIWTTDRDGYLTYLSETCQPLIGWRPEEVVGKHFSELIAPESMAVVIEHWQRVQEEPNRRQQYRLSLLHRDGSHLPMEINAVGRMIDGAFAGAHGSVRDIRERERLEADLRRQAAALAANEERANLARELHDSVTQALFSMGLTTRALELLLDRDPAAARDKLAELRDLQKDALAEMRALIFELRPQGLETDGLVQALRNHAAAVQGRTGMAVSVEVDFAERLALDVEESLYRIAQEALHNVIKHANADQAWITVRSDEGRLLLTVEDDGIGFDPARAPRGHLGLVSMNQRAERIGAELDIAPRPEGGSRVRVAMALPSAPAPEPAVASAE